MCVYLQNPWCGSLFFPAPSGAPSGGRRPLEMECTFPNTLSRVISEYMWLGWSISKNPWSGSLFFPAPSGAPSGGRPPLEMQYAYPSSLCYVV